MKKNKPFTKECKYPVNYQRNLEKLAHKKGSNVNAEIREAIREKLEREGYEL